MNSSFLAASAHRLRSMGFLMAAWFNTMFTILSAVTLLGIVLITKPRQVLHNVEPEWWLPLLLTVVPSQVYCQWITWRTKLEGKVLSPFEIARSQKTPHWILKPLLAFLWLMNFMIGFIIVVSLYKPVPMNNLGILGFLFIGFIAFALTSFANVYLLLAVRMVTASEAILLRVWRCRVFIDLFIAGAATVYYKIIL